LRLDGTENFVEAQNLAQVWAMLEDFRREIEKDARAKWDIFQACEIMRVNPEWFIDERSIELVELYLFYRQNPATAFPGTFSEQPAIWLEAKPLLDSVIGPIGIF
jgi:hypothetical protein